MERAEQETRDLERRPGETQLSLALPFVEHAREPCFVAGEEAANLLLHRLRQCRVLGGDHAAEAQAVMDEHASVERDVSPELLGCAARLRVNRAEVAREHVVITRHERAPELRLRRKVVVEARLGDAELARDVGVAEAIEPARLRETLGRIENAI